MLQQLFFQPIFCPVSFHANINVQSGIHLMSSYSLNVKYYLEICCEGNSCSLESAHKKTFPSFLPPQETVFPETQKIEFLMRWVFGELSDITVCQRECKLHNQVIGTASVEERSKSNFGLLSHGTVCMLLFLVSQLSMELKQGRLIP